MNEPNAKSTKTWVLVLTSVGSFMALDAAGRRDGVDRYPPGSRRLARGVGVDGERLQPELRRAADDGGGTRRPPRAAAHVCRRPGVVHRGLGRLRARAQHRLADSRPRRPGGRRRVDHAAAERGVPSGGTGQSAWAV